MSRRHPHGFPKDTPEPSAQPYGAIDALLQLVVAWVKLSAVCAASIGLLALFFPSVFNLFR